MRNIAILALAVLVMAGALITSGCCCCTFPVHIPDNSPVLNPKADVKTDTFSHAPAGNVTLNLDTDRSYLEIVQTTDPNISVKIDAYAPSGQLDTMKSSLAFSEGNGSLGLDLRTRAELTENVIIGENLKRFEVRIGLPAGSNYAVSMDSENSAINVTGLNGSTITIRTTNALVSIIGGDYESIDVTTTNGAILANYNAKNSSFSTTNGLVRLETAQSTGLLKASTTNGILGVRLKNGNGFNIDASITNGLITHSGFDIDGTSTWNVLRGKTPGYTGDFRIELSATNGNINIGY